MKEKPIGRERIVEQIDVCPMFKMMSQENKAMLSRFAQVKHYKKGENLFVQDAVSNGFYAILKGKVKIARVGIEGREQILHIYGRGEICGEVPVFQGGRYPATAQALGVVEAIFIEGGDFLDLGEKHPAILLEMLAVLSMRLRKFVNLVDDLSLKEVSARLAKYLLDQSVKAGGDEFELDVSKSMLAAKLGTISETVSRTFKKMSDSGIIKMQGKAIRLIDRESVVELAAGKKL